MGSFADILLFIPLLFCHMLFTLTSASCSLGVSAGHYLTDRALRATQLVCHPLRVCYAMVIRRYSALVNYGWTGWTKPYRVVTYPFVVCADLLNRLIEFVKISAHICTAAFNWWLSVTLTIITTPWRLTCYASSSFDNWKPFNSWAHVFLDLPSRARMILYDIWTQLKKESLQLLWYLTPYPCKTVSTWLWPESRQHSSTSQVQYLRCLATLLFSYCFR